MDVIQPPHSIDAEQAVLGALMMDPKAWGMLDGSLRPADFYRHDHQVIYGAITALVRRNQPIDAVTVAEQLLQHRDASQIGLAYLAGLVRDTPSVANVATYARIVTDRAAKRRLASLAANLQSSTLKPTSESAAEIGARALRDLGDMLVTAPSEFEEPTSTLFDLAQCDAAELLQTYHRTRGSYCTSPFDDGRRLRFYDRGYSIWSGYPGSGKTTALRQLVCHLLHAGRKVFVASLEEHPVDVIVHLAGVAYGCEVPTINQLQWFIDFYQDSLRIWGITGTSSHSQILGTAQRLAKQGFTQALIDNLDCLDIDAKDIELQRQFARKVNALTIESNLHVQLVAHPRKSLSSQQESDLNDVAGAASLGRLAHNIIFVRREKSQSNTQIQDVGGMRIAVRKQRYGSGFIGDIDGVLNRRIRQFKVDPMDQIPTQYLPKQAYQDR